MCAPVKVCVGNRSPGGGETGCCGLTFVESDGRWKSPSDPSDARDEDRFKLDLSVERVGRARGSRRGPRSSERLGESR